MLNEWSVVAVIISLVGLGTAVIKPIISLNATITRLTEVVNTLEKNLSLIATKNSESHGKLWQKIGSHEEVLGFHETRLQLLEEREDK